MNDAKKATAILVVEDEEIIALDIKCQLEDMGYTVPATVSSGEEAITWAEKIQPDIVFMDVVLKGEMDGIVAAHTINEKFHIPVIFLTSFSDEDTIRRAKLSSPYGYITKPFENRSLRTAVEFALYKHSVDLKQRAAEQRYHAIMEHAACGIIVISLANKIIDLNLKAQKILGRDRSQLIDQHFMDFIPAVEKGYASLQMGKLLTQKIVGPNDGKVLMPNGAIHDIEFTAVYIDNEQEKFVFGILDDVTERNKLRMQAKLSDKLAMIGTLSTGIIHEINNPMTYILSNLSYISGKLKMLKEEEKTKLLTNIEEAVEESIQGAVKIEDIVRNLKGFARVDQQELSEVNIKNIFDAVIKMAHPQIKNIAVVETEFDPAMPNILSSQSKLHQVFLNLVINATQAMEEKGDIHQNKILIKTSLQKDQINIDISDNGKGMPPEVSSNIFEPFFTTKKTGTGLGLSICYDIIRELGGTINVASEVGSGTRFSIQLPLHLIVTPAVPSKASPITNMNILVVDDEPTILMVLERMLGDENKVTLAQGGRAALYLLQDIQNSYDVIICDLNMPDVSGMDLYQFALQKDQSLAAKFVFFTGGIYTEKAANFIAGINNPCMQKPFAFDQVSQAIQSVMAKAS